MSTDVDYVSRLDRVCVCDLARENPRGRKNPCGEGICYHVKQKEGEKKDNPRPTNRRHQDVFARARTWCSGGAGAMTGTDRTNRIVRRNPLFFFLIRQLFPLLRALCILEIRGSNAAPLVPHSLRSRIEILKFRGVQFRFCWRASRRLSRNLASVVFGNYRLTGFDRDGGGVLKVSSVGFHRRISPG